ncbi:MAG TPA: hypothetical protein VGL42_03790 [Opitutaceae bacterium]|jgi:glutathione synthase/RimK-type ligase-like ATP-grasp enzyme
MLTPAIITRRDDLDADAVILRLRARGCLPIRINWEDIYEDAAFSLRLSNEGAPSGRVATDRRQIDVDQIKAAYWRPTLLELPAHESPDGAYIRGEIDGAWTALYRLLDCTWFNRPAAVQSSGCILKRLDRAKAAGFQIPETLISDDPRQLVEFCRAAGGRVVVRPVRLGPIALVANEGRSLLPHWIRSALVTLEELSANVDQLGQSPSILQRYVTGRKVIKVAIVKERLFAAAFTFERGANPLPAAVDLSASGHPQEINLPSTAEKACRALASELGFNYAIVTLVESEAEGLYLIDIDPNASFLWLERVFPQFQIGARLAEELASS